MQRVVYIAEEMISRGSGVRRIKKGVRGGNGRVGGQLVCSNRIETLNGKVDTYREVCA